MTLSTANRSERALSRVYPILYAFFGKDGGLDPGAMRAQVPPACR